MSLARQIVPAGEGRALTLLRYDAACRALAEAKSVDDVKDIRDRSEAMRAYAKQAKNKQLEVDAAEIRIRAERRLGDMIAAQRDAGLLSKGAAAEGVGKRGSQANPHLAPTLAEAGIDKNLADRARKLAAIPESEFTEIVSDWRERVERENERVSINLLRSGERHAAAKPAAQEPETINGYDAIVEAWTAATPEDREAFIAYLRVSGVIPSFPALDRDGANSEQDDVDGSALRADRAGQDINALAGQIETRTKAEIVDGNASLAAREGEKVAASSPHPQPTSSQAADPAGDAPGLTSPADLSETSGGDDPAVAGHSTDEASPSSGPAHVSRSAAPLPQSGAVPVPSPPAPATIHDPSDPGPIPAFLDRRAKKDEAA